VRPIIEATFPLEKARQTFERGLGGHNHGKIVLQVAPEMAADYGKKSRRRLLDGLTNLIQEEQDECDR